MYYIITAVLSYNYSCIMRVLRLVYKKGRGVSGCCSRHLRQRHLYLYVCDRKVTSTAVGTALEPVFVDPVQQYNCLTLLCTKKKKNLLRYLLEICFKKWWQIHGIVTLNVCYVLIFTIFNIHSPKMKEHLSLLLLQTILSTLSTLLNEHIIIYV